MSSPVNPDIFLSPQDEALWVAADEAFATYAAMLREAEAANVFAPLDIPSVRAALDRFRGAETTFARSPSGRLRETWKPYLRGTIFVAPPEPIDPA